MNEKKESKFIKWFKSVIINMKQLKYFIFAGVFLCLLLIFLGSRFIPAMFASSVYTINDLSDNMDKVRAGDIINYEINGYRNWRVLSVDKKNGTVDVTSSSNVYDLTLEPNKTLDEYKNIFQQEADKFYDKNYVVNARTIAKSDSLMFDSSGEYWLANINENTLMTNRTGAQDTSTIFFHDYPDIKEIYALPYIMVSTSRNQATPANRTKLNISVNGINSWTFYGRWNYSGASYKHLMYVADTPTVLQVDGISGVFDAINNHFGNFHDVSSSNNVNVVDYGLTSYSSNSNDYKNIFNTVLKEKDFVYILNSSDIGRSSDYYISDSRLCREKKYYIECNKYNFIKLYSDGSTKSVYNSYLAKTLTFGYRPVLTLKINKEDNTGKSTSDKLKVGDNVKYEANGYRNWKVLSFDDTEGTVDIISGGIVKNISFYGYDDYNNYESILQREVNEYMNDDAISARAINNVDVKRLNRMNDSVSGMYWFNKKAANVRTSISSLASNTSSVGRFRSYDIGLLWTNTGDYYVNDIVNSSSSSDITKYWVSLYYENIDMSSPEYGSYGMSGSMEYYIGDGMYNYIAGLRPIITLKYDSVKTLSSKQAKKLDASSKDYDKYYVAEQTLNNSRKGVSDMLFSDDGVSSNNGSSKNDSSKSYRNKVDVSLGETEGILKLALVLAIIYGFVIVGLVVFVVVYRIRKKKEYHKNIDFY